MTEIRSIRHKMTKRKPLQSVEELSYQEYPVVEIPDQKRIAIEECARRIAENWYGEPEDHITGKLGEWAVAHYLGIKDNFDTSIRTDGGDGGYDLTTTDWSTRKIEVKTVQAQQTDPGLTIDHTEPLNADWYVLTRQISKNYIQIIGWAPKQTIQTARKQDDMGDYCLVDQEYLFPMS